MKATIFLQKKGKGGFQKWYLLKRIIHFTSRISTTLIFHFHFILNYLSILYIFEEMNIFFVINYVFIHVFELNNYVINFKFNIYWIEIFIYYWIGDKTTEIVNKLIKSDK